MYTTGIRRTKKKNKQVIFSIRYSVMQFLVCNKVYSVRCFQWKIMIFTLYCCDAISFATRAVECNGYSNTYYNIVSLCVQLTKCWQNASPYHISACYHFRSDEILTEEYVLDRSVRYDSHILSPILYFICRNSDDFI